MRLLSLEAKNVFSIGHAKVDLDGRGLVLVTGYSEDEGGANGAGKSSVANKAILWGLFGETAGGLKADAVLNRHGKKKGFVEIDFEGSDGKNYRVKRERPARLNLFAGSTDISAHTAKATQELIDQLLGLDFKTFLQTSFFGQGRTLHYPSLTPKEQKAVLENILPMEDADRWAEYADKQLKTLQPKLRDAEIGLRQAESREQTLDEQLTDCGRRGVVFEDQRKQDIEELGTKLSSIDSHYAPRFEQLEVVKQGIDAVDPDATRVLIDDKYARIGELTPKKEEAQTTQGEALDSATRWKARKSFLKVQRAELNLDRKCPLCLRDYDDTSVAAVSDRAKLLDRQLEECDTNIHQADIAAQHYGNEVTLAYREMTDLAEGIEELKKSLQQADEYSRQKQVLEHQIEASKAGFQAKLEEATNRVNPYVEQHESLKVSVEAAKCETNKLNAAYGTLKVELGHLTYWRDVYGKELKLKLFEDACPFLDNRTQYHLGQLKNPQIHCEFTTIKRLATGKPKEEFNVSVWSETGGRGFDSLSGGEQQMVSFAIGLALADLASRVAGSQSGFLILDEPFTELDERNGEAIVEYLTTEVENGLDSIFLISNEESLKGLVPNRIHVTKRKGITHV